MKHIFVRTNKDSPNVGDVKFNLSFAEIDINTLWSEVEQHSINATRFAIIPFIGREIYDDIVEKIEDDNLSEEHLEFVALLRLAVAYHTAVQYFPKKYTVTSATGIGQNQSGKFATASLAAYKTSLWDITKSADRHLDELLAFMERQVALENPYFDLWKNNPAYQNAKTPFFRATTEFQQYFNIFNSRSTFLSLISHISDICEDVISPIVCNDLFNEIVSEIATATISDENRQLLHLIRRAVAPLAVAKAAPYLQILVEADGFKVVSSTDSMDKRDTPMRHHQSLVQSLTERCAIDGQKALNLLKKHIVDNADKFPLYLNSPCHKAATARAARFGVEVLTDARSGGAGGTGAYIYRRK